MNCQNKAVYVEDTFFSLALHRRRLSEGYKIIEYLIRYPFSISMNFITREIAERIVINFYAFRYRSF